MMLRSAARRVLWVAKGMALFGGAAVTLALVLGLGSAALAGTGVGARLHLGKTDAVDAVSALAGTVSGPTLRLENGAEDRLATAPELRVAHDGITPMRTDSTQTVANPSADSVDGRDASSFAAGTGGKADDADELDGRDSSTFAAGTGGKADDADRLDGKDRTELGVNGLQQAISTSVIDSTSPKTTTASCPGGKVVVGTGFDIIGGRSGAFPNEQSDVVVDNAQPLTPVATLPTQVFVLAYEETPTDANWSVRAIAICAQRP